MIHNTLGKTIARRVTMNCSKFEEKKNSFFFHCSNSSSIVNLLLLILIHFVYLQNEINTNFNMSNQGFESGKLVI